MIAVCCIYRRMPAEWRGIPPEGRFRMTEDQVKAVLDAGGRSNAG